MKHEMSAFDILAMVGELQVLVGGYMDKIFHWDGRNVLLRINTPTDGRKELVLQDLKWLYLAPERPETPDFPSQFAVNLRKHLTNARVTSVQQREFDRIVVMELEKGPVTYQIVIELFGGGNLIVVSEGKIINSVTSRKWRYREVRPGSDYSFPPSRTDPRDMDIDAFRHTMMDSSSDTVRTLATAINLGGQYAEETCLRAEVDKARKAKELSEEEMGGLHQALVLLLREAQENRQPREVLKNGKPVDVTSIPLIQYVDEESREHNTYSDALHAYLSSRELPVKEDPELARLKRQLERQQEAIDAQEAKARTFVEMAEAIYSDYMGTEAILNAAEKLNGISWEQAREEGAKIPGVISIDPKEHTLRAMIAGKEVILDYNVGVEGNADRMYQTSKEFRDKMEGAKQAIQETKTRLAKRKKEGERQKQVEKHTASKTKEFWFERYKWFITTGGKLVLSGRDARTNDQVVKKHLKTTDRYAHADLHGAPSVVIKEGESATDEDMEEVCAFALAHSKAWTAGAREGTAYWVLPDQVSKMAQAGEFVPRGAFIIRGKRNYLNHLPLKMAVGEIEHEGARKIMCGPPTSVLARSERYVIIQPGKSDRSKVSAQLSRTFEVPEEEISRILPPGDVEIVEKKGLE